MSEENKVSNENKGNGDLAIVRHSAARVDWMDVQELAAHILNMDEDSEYDEVEEKVYEEFECSMETFEKIVAHLVPCAAIAKSPLTDDVYRGFSKPMPDGGACWIVRESVG